MAEVEYRTLPCTIQCYIRVYSLFSSRFAHDSEHLTKSTNSEHLTSPATIEKVRLSLYLVSLQLSIHA